MLCMECERLREGYVKYCPICEHKCHCEANFITDYDNCYGDY